MARFLTVEDLAARWQLSKRSVQRIVRRYRKSLLKPTKLLKRTLRWRLERIETFERGRTR